MTPFEFVSPRSLLADLEQLGAGTVSAESMVQAVCNRIEYVDTYIRGGP